MTAIGHNQPFKVCTSFRPFGKTFLLSACKMAVFPMLLSRPMPLQFPHIFAVLALLLATVVQADCPAALPYLQATFSAAKAQFTSKYGDRYYYNSPGCSGNDFELVPSNPNDLTACQIGGRPLKTFSLVGFADLDLPLSARYVFAGEPISKTEAEGLLRQKLVSAKGIPEPLDQVISKEYSAEVYRTEEGNYLVRSPVDPSGPTLMIIRTATIKPAAKNIAACADARR